MEYNIVVPILEELGWPKLIDADSDYVIKPRHSIEGWRKNEGGVVDFALCVSNKPKVFVEAKKVEQGGFSKKEQGQLLGYCMHADVPIGILTNGFDWHIYLKPKSLKPNDVANALAQEIAIDQGDVTDISKTLERLLGRNSISSGNVEKVLRRERSLFSKTIQKERNLHRMNEAWDQLFGSEHQSLQKALTTPLKKILKEKLGISDKKPLPYPVRKDRQIETFVKNKCVELKNIMGQRAVSHPDKTQSSSKNKNATTTRQVPAYFYVFGAKMEFRTWRESAQRFLDEVCRRYPDSPKQLAEDLPNKFVRSATKPHERRGKPLERWQKVHPMGNSGVWAHLNQNQTYIRGLCRDVCKTLGLPEDTIRFE